MRYTSPSSADEALGLLAEQGAGAKVLAGGTDLLVALRHRTVEPAVVVDIKRVAEFAEPVRVTDDAIVVGPTATMGRLAELEEVRRRHVALVEAALTVGSVAIRNRASLVGNSCNASPGADTAPVLLALGAAVTIAGPAGERTIALDDFFLGPRRTACGPDELVTALHLPRPRPGSGSSFQRITRRRGVDLGTVSIAAVLGPDDDVALGMGAVGPRPLVARTRLGDHETTAAAVEHLVAAATPIDDVRAGSDYRRAMLRVLARRALDTAARRRDEEAA